MTVRDFGLLKFLAHYKSINTDHQLSKLSNPRRCCTFNHFSHRSNLPPAFPLKTAIARFFIAKPNSKNTSCFTPFLSPSRGAQHTGSTGGAASIRRGNHHTSSAGLPNPPSPTGQSVVLPAYVQLASRFTNSSGYWWSLAVSIHTGGLHCRRGTISVAVCGALSQYITVCPPSHPHISVVTVRLNHVVTKALMHFESPF